MNFIEKVFQVNRTLTNERVTDFLKKVQAKKWYKKKEKDTVWNSQYAAAEN